MQHISSLGRALLMAVALVSTPAVVFAADSDGSFSGTVIDPSGSSVSGATIVARNERTGEERVVVANADGRYVLTGLRPSIYTITVTYQGFAPRRVHRPAAGRGAGVPARPDAPGRRASPRPSRCKGTATAMDLSSARIGVNVSEREVAEPAGQRPADVAADAAGAGLAELRHRHLAATSASAAAPTEQNVIRYDGVEGSAIIDAAPGNLNGEIPSPFKLQASLENVQEFRVESNNYPAEFGTGTGGQVNVVTKSGSNLLRGSVFEYYRNDKLDAPNYFDTRNTTAASSGAAEVDSSTSTSSAARSAGRS